MTNKLVKDVLNDRFSLVEEVDLSVYCIITRVLKAAIQNDASIESFINELVKQLMNLKISIHYTVRARLLSSCVKCLTTAIKNIITLTY